MEVVILLVALLCVYNGCYCHSINGKFEQSWIFFKIYLVCLRVEVLAEMHTLLEDSKLFELWEILF